MADIRFTVHSPDGFSISPDSYESEAQARLAYKQWARRYEIQGYYSSCNGRIALQDLQSNCQLVTIKDGKESYKTL